jgi:hypothetical protein
MVQLWISLFNDKILRPCINQKKICRILKNSYTRFGGDYELEIYLGTKNEYNSLEEIVQKVFKNGSGWIKNLKYYEKKELPFSKYELLNVLWNFGRVDENDLKDFYPRKETFEPIQYFQYRNDGNFQCFALETTKFYYVYCFATS